MGVPGVSDGHLVQVRTHIFAPNGSVGDPGGRQPDWLFPIPEQHFVEAGLRHVGDAGDVIGEPSLRVDVVELCRRDQPQLERAAVSAAVGTSED